MRISPRGKFVGFIDPPGMTAATTYLPKSFHIDQQDNIYILEKFSGQLIILNPQGKLLKNIAVPPTRGFFSDLTVDAGGNILLLDSVNARVFLKAAHAS